MPTSLAMASADRLGMRWCRRVMLSKSTYWLDGRLSTPAHDGVVAGTSAAPAAQTQRLMANCSNRFRQSRSPCLADADVNVAHDRETSVVRQRMQLGAPPGDGRCVSSGLLAQWRSLASAGELPCLVMQQRPRSTRWRAGGGLAGETGMAAIFLTSSRIGCLANMDRRPVRGRCSSPTSAGMVVSGGS